MAEITEQDRIVKVGDEELYIKDPSVTDRRDSQKIYNKEFKESVESGAYFRAQLNEILMKNGVWSEDQEKRSRELEKEIDDLELKLRKGGIKLSKAKDLAISIRTKRFEWRILRAARHQYDVNSVESIAENAQLNFLLSKCVVYNKDRKKPYYKSYEDYLSRADDEGGSEIASTFFRIYFGTAATDKELVENKFLTKYNFVNSNGQFVDSENRLVDAQNRHVDERGRLIRWNDDGTFTYITEKGEECDEDGNVKIEFKPFIDDETGEPVEDSDEKPVKKSKKSS